MTINTYREVDLVEYIKILRRRKTFILKTTMVVAILGVAVMLLRPSSLRYEAKGIIKIGAISDELLMTQAEVATEFSTEQTAYEILSELRASEQPISERQLRNFIGNLKLAKSEDDSLLANYQYTAFQSVDKMEAKKTVEVVQKAILARHKEQHQLKIKHRDEIITQKEKELIKKADLVFVTTDDPHAEDPQNIINDIKGGMINDQCPISNIEFQKANYFIIDRKTKRECCHASVFDRGIGRRLCPVFFLWTVRSG